MTIRVNPVLTQQVRLSKPVTRSASESAAAPQFAGGGEKPARSLTGMMALAVLGLSGLGLGGMTPVRANPPAEAVKAVESAAPVTKGIIQEVRDNYRLASYLTQLTLEAHTKTLQDIAGAETDAAKASIKEQIVNGLKTNIGYTELAKFTLERAEKFEKETQKDDIAHISAKVNLNKTRQTVQLATDSQTAQINAIVDNHILSKAEVKELLEEGKTSMEMFQKQDPALQEMVLLNSLASYTGIEAAKSYAFTGQVAATAFNGKMKGELRTVSKLVEQSAHFKEKAQTLLTNAKSVEAKQQITELIKPLEVSLTQVEQTRTKSIELAKEMGFTDKEIAEILK